MSHSSVTSVPVTAESWQCKTQKVVSRTTFLLNSPEMSDVQFIFNTHGDTGETTIYGHKLILAMASPVFQKMFFGQNDQFTTTVESRMDMNQHPFTAEAFLAFMMFLYTDRINYDGLSMEVIVGVLTCIDYFDVPYLETDCIKQLDKILSTKNVIQILETAVLFREDDLTGKALELIDQNAGFVFESEEILCAKIETLILILKRDSLDIDECFVLKLALKWAEHECNRIHLEVTVENQRKMLGEVFFEIRFALLTSDTISKLVCSRFLTPKESVDVLLAVHRPVRGTASTTAGPEFTRICPDVSFKSIPRVRRKLELSGIRKRVVIRSESELKYFKAVANAFR